MKQTYDKEQRQQQKEILKKIYPDYDPKRHDAFVQRYQKEQEEKALEEYHKQRGIKDNPMDPKVAWKQISAGAKMQVGARNAVGAEDQLTFEVLKRKGGKIYKISVSLDDEDTYSIKLMQIDINSYDVDTLEEYTGIYAEELSRAIISICDTLQKKKRNTDEEDDGYAHQYYDENPESTDDKSVDLDRLLGNATWIVETAIMKFVGVSPQTAALYGSKIPTEHLSPSQVSTLNKMVELRNGLSELQWSMRGLDVSITKKRKSKR